MNHKAQLNRRHFVQGAAAIGTLLATGGISSADSHTATRPKFCAFTKFLQDLSYEELASTIKDLGFDGVEATVRRKGHVLPERVEDDLPKMFEALKAQDIEVTAIASDVLEADELSQKVLRTASGLGIKRYRMGFYKYDPGQSVLPQLDEMRPKIADLVALNRELDMQALYQNHSGAKYMGATLWDLHSLIKDHPVEYMASAFDIRHATIEAGLAWPKLYDIMKPHIGAIFVKDFQWHDKKAEHVPLGTGRVDPKFFEMVKQDKFAGPYSLHVEYLKKEGVQANIDALRRDFAVLKKWVG